MRLLVQLFFVVGYIGLTCAVPDDVSMAIAVIACRQQVDNPLRRLFYSIARVKNQESRINMFILYYPPFLKSMEGDPKGLLCKSIGENCERLLTILRTTHSMNISFIPLPHSEHMNIFKPCATSRLWLPKLLPESENVVIYLDTDTLVLEDLHPLWLEIRLFSEDTLMGVVPELFRGPEFPIVPNLTSTAPIMVWPRGINTGMMLLHLTKMRHSNFSEEITSILHSGASLRAGDQCVINIYASRHPNSYRLLPCKWNTRGHPHRTDDHCVENMEAPAGILHGSRGHFISPRVWLDAHVGGNSTIRRNLAAMNQLYVENAKLMNADDIWVDA